MHILLYTPFGHHHFKTAPVRKKLLVVITTQILFAAWLFICSNRVCYSHSFSLQRVHRVIQVCFLFPISRMSLVLFHSSSVRNGYNAADIRFIRFALMDEKLWEQFCSSTLPWIWCMSNICSSQLLQSLYLWKAICLRCDACTPSATVNFSFTTL